jgi:hypothetical protein
VCLHDDTPPSYDETRGASEIPGAGDSAECPPAEDQRSVRDGKSLSAAVAKPWMAENDAQRAAIHGFGEVQMSEQQVQFALDRFYRDLLYELGEFALRPGSTAIGAAVVVKRVAKTYGIDSADRLPLPRYSRAEREERVSARWLAEQ